MASTADLAEEALKVAVASEIAAYDAAYVVQAGHLSLPLVTADEALLRRIVGSGLDVRFLGDWP